MGMAATTQVAGDCEKKVCDGKGTASQTPDDTDLPDDGTLCTSNLCTNGVPAFPPVAAGTACADHGGKVCDGAGKCVGCVGDADCPGGACSMSTCVGATCADHVQDGTETDVDCGGPSCPGCTAGGHCMMGSDCHDGVCTGGICQMPSCTDMVKNGNETAVDCGGGTCDPCPNGDACLMPSDCTSGFCAGGLCSKLLNACDPATATDLTGMASTTIAFGGATGDMYTPPCIKVSVGTVVTFNGDFTTHPLQGGVVAGVTATPDASGPLAMVTSAGMTAPFAMSVAGSYGFYCTVHWPLGMKGAIFVQ
jgi:plastocyanin